MTDVILNKAELELILDLIKTEKDVAWEHGIDEIPCDIAELEKKIKKILETA